MNKYYGSVKLVVVLEIHLLRYYLYGLVKIISMYAITYKYTTYISVNVKLKHIQNLFCNL